MKYTLMYKGKFLSSISQDGEAYFTADKPMSVIYPKVGYKTCFDTRDEAYDVYYRILEFKRNKMGTVIKFPWEVPYCENRNETMEKCDLFPEVICFNETQFAGSACGV